MAVPKSRSSKSRVRKRRSMNIKLQKPQLNRCPQCDSLNYQSHRVCADCGYYNGRQVISVEAGA
ncbi:MAG: 50S ribosomal protein L32 [Opitutia bacterium TMED67]|nr:50S ribosomal protein L32 [Verrucomicrobiales bacterium]MDC0316634.1 50S ribosomal protein L32 [Verrucomicrobiota bacterium]OUU73070.1 MAG: 50S ribosomal protein L32 [Opitutae bacterium TMED67]RZO55192.1 MAG: 50S ribosomal protein L32 [Limisphaerales bacterium]